MADLERVRRTLARHGQTHLLGFYEELSDAQREDLLEQIEAIDFDRLGELIRQYVLNNPALDLSGKIEPVEIVPACPACLPQRQADEAASSLRRRARRRGEELIAAGKVAAFTVAGGQGTRLGYDGPKGCLEVTPVRHKPLFQVFAEQILAVSRRWSRTIPWYILTSPANDRATREFFERRGYFGLDAADVFFCTQGTLPVIDFSGKLLLADKGHVARAPNGHGGGLSAMRASGALDEMASRGVELISYFQVDNPLVRCLDPVFLGLHEMRGAEMSAKVLSKRDPMERLGNVCLLDGKVTVIEYSDMPTDLAKQTTDDGHLRFSAGSIAVHVISRSFVERLTAQGGSPPPFAAPPSPERCSLPLHRAEKKVAFVGESGRVIKPDKPNAVKLEMFIFDALPLARNPLILETQRSEEFSPVKNASGADSLATSMRDQVRRAASWLEAAGIKVPRDADGQVAAGIEISPLLADSAEELAAKVDRKLTVKPGDHLYLE